MTSGTCGAFGVWCKRTYAYGVCSEKTGETVDGSHLISLTLMRELSTQLTERAVSVHKKKADRDAHGGCLCKGKRKGQTAMVCPSYAICYLSAALTSSAELEKIIVEK